LLELLRLVLVVTQQMKFRIDAIGIVLVGMTKVRVAREMIARGNGVVQANELKMTTNPHLEQDAFLTTSLQTLKSHDVDNT